MKTNHYTIKNRTVLIDVSTKTHPNLITIIDLLDLNLVIDGKGRWSPRKANDGRISIVRGQPTQRLSHHILSVKNVMVDHIDGDVLNHRRKNLRIVNNIQNSTNRRSVGKYGFKGVDKAAGKGGYRAAITINGKRVRFNSFKTPEDAAKKYDEEAIKAYGEYACTNKNMGLLFLKRK